LLPLLESLIEKPADGRLFCGIFGRSGEIARKRPRSAEFCGLFHVTNGHLMPIRRPVAAGVAISNSFSFPHFFFSKLIGSSS
jgi:hypothetical protein